MNLDDARIEAMLARYRPAGPPERLKGRVLSLANTRRSRWTVAGWSAMAAMLVVSLGLRLVTEQLLHRAAATIGEPPARWTADAEEAAALLDGDGAGRRYIRLALAAGRPPTGPPSFATPTSPMGEPQ